MSVETSHYVLVLQNLPQMVWNVYVADSDGFCLHYDPISPERPHDLRRRPVQIQGLSTAMLEVSVAMAHPSDAIPLGCFMHLTSPLESIYDVAYSSSLALEDLLEFTSKFGSGEVDGIMRRGITDSRPDLKVSGLEPDDSMNKNMHSSRRSLIDSNHKLEGSMLLASKLRAQNCVFDSQSSSSL